MRDRTRVALACLVCVVAASGVVKWVTAVTGRDLASGVVGSVEVVLALLLSWRPTASLSALAVAFGYLGASIAEYVVPTAGSCGCLRPLGFPAVATTVVRGFVIVLCGIFLLDEHVVEGVSTPRGTPHGGRSSGTRWVPCRRTAPSPPSK